LEDLLERERLGPAVDQGDHDDRERLLERRHRVELVQDDVDVLALADLDLDLHAVAAGQVAHVADAADGILFDEVRDAFDEVRLVQVVGNLDDGDGLLAVLRLFDLDLAAHGDVAAAGLVGAAQAGRAVMMPPVGSPGRG
jgi:hypothetical protein